MSTFFTALHGSTCVNSFTIWSTLYGLTKKLLNFTKYIENLWNINVIISLCVFIMFESNGKLLHYFPKKFGINWISTLKCEILRQREINLFTNNLSYSIQIKLFNFKQ